MMFWHKALMMFIMERTVGRHWEPQQDEPPQHGASMPLRHWTLPQTAAHGQDGKYGVELQPSGKIKYHARGRRAEGGGRGQSPTSEGIIFHFA